MKKTWLILLICFMLLLSGCKAQIPQDDEVAEVITDKQNAPADENSEELPEQNAPAEEQPEELPEDTPPVAEQIEEKEKQYEEQPQSDNNAITIEQAFTYIIHVGDGFVIVDTSYNDAPFYFKLYTENKYAQTGDLVVFSGDVIPLEKSEKYGKTTVYYVAKEDATAKFSFDPNDLNVSGNVCSVEKNYFIVSVDRHRGIKVYTDNPSEYCEGDYLNIQGVATPIEPYTVTFNDIGHTEVCFELRNAEISFADDGLIKKPVIYLYPEEETEVSVALTLDGELTCVYPEYDGAWEVTARPDGTLIDKNGREYYCLYWEGEFNETLVDNKDVGFVVNGSDTAEFLREKLLYLGLNEREANEFIIYWLPQMEDNPYNYIYFSGTEYTQSAKLDIAPNPDTLIRIMMAWEPLDTPREVTEQKLQKAPERRGFTAVEWGGAKIS